MSLRKYRETKRGSTPEALQHLLVLLLVLHSLTAAASPEAAALATWVLTVAYVSWSFLTTKYRIDVTGAVEIGPLWLLLTLLAAVLHLVLGGALAIVAGGFLGFVDGTSRSALEILARQLLPTLAGLASVAVLVTGVPKRFRRKRLERAREHSIASLQLWIALPLAAAFLGLHVAFGSSADISWTLGLATAGPGTPAAGAAPGVAVRHLILTGVAFALASYRPFLWQYERHVAGSVSGVRAVYGEDYPERNPLAMSVLLVLGCLMVLAGALIVITS